MRTYGDRIAEHIETAKADGYEKVVLYGESNLDFLLAYECQKQAMPFEQRAATELTGVIEQDVYAVQGERDMADTVVAARAVSVMEMAG